MESIVTAEEVKDFLFSQIDVTLFPDEFSDPEFVVTVKERLFQKFFKSVKEYNSHNYSQLDVDKFVKEQM